MSSQDPLEVTAADLQGRLDRAGKDYLLVDVRETFELNRGILPGAVSLPMSQIEARREELDRDREVVCYCEHGVRSYNVAAWLESHGYRARSLAGGFAEWSGPVAPPETGPA